ncbi:MAG: MATE family efflux transporter [Clostridia bacterium]|nr:MATE family efflux transporter [Clostridia bacterium]
MPAKKNSIDMVNGPLWGKILKFALLYLLTALLQHLYSAADEIIVGRYAGELALSGVGACSALITLFLNFILGLSAGATIVLGQAIGADDKHDISKTCHTAITIAILGGALMTVLCLAMPRQLLLLTNVPENVMPEALSYLKVRAIGFVPALVYNFSAALLRAKGDTKRALYIVSASGVINIALNLFFVCVLDMTADGVAAATVIAQTFTAASMLFILCREKDDTKISLKSLRIYKDQFTKIIKFGLPSGIQSSVYSVSNILVQSSINSFESAFAIAGSTAVTSITRFYNEAVNCFYQAAMVFVSQNFGAKKFDRIKKTILICLTYVLCMWGLQSVITFFGSEFLISLYAPGQTEVIEWGMRKMCIVGYSYGLLGFMNVMSGALRGMGASFANMITSIVGVCGIRIMWILTAFAMIGTFESLFVCYPLSWFGTFIIHLLMFIAVFRKEKNKTPKISPAFAA